MNHHIEPRCPGCGFKIRVPTWEPQTTYIEKGCKHCGRRWRIVVRHTFEVRPHPTEICVGAFVQRVTFKEVQA
jgi:hypothetical protein